MCGHDSSVGIANRYGLDDPGIESRKGREISYPSRRALRPIQLPKNGYRLLPGVKRPGRGVDHPPYLAPGLQEDYSYTSNSPLGLRDVL